MRKPGSAIGVMDNTIIVLSCLNEKDKEKFMNMTIVGTAMFLSFAASIGFSAWLASRGETGAAILLSIFIILFFGSVKMSKKDTIATCPKCEHVFEVKASD
jgi:hypothetical protein